MGVFKNKKHTSSLYKVVKNSQRSEPMVTHGKSKQSKETVVEKPTKAKESLRKKISKNKFIL